MHTPTRTEALAKENSPAQPIARHGRLKARSALSTIRAAALTTILVAGISVGAVVAYATLDVYATANSKEGVALVDERGVEMAPKVGAVDGAFNVLLAGSDSGGGNPAYDVRGETLNDVTMLLHVSADHRDATIVSFPRDMYIPIPSCPDGAGGSFDAMTRQKLNTSLSYGGLACTVLTVKQLTGLDIDFAGVIEFDGVIEMSNAVGGVPVCVEGDIIDDKSGLNITAGDNTLQGAQALAFLRTRYGVGDGSDLARISNQQVFLSSLVRTVRSAETLSNPLKVYALAKAAVNNIQLSESLKNITTIASLGIALKDIDVSKVVFVQYPNHYVDGGVAPTIEEAELLMSALRNDRAVKLTGDTGLGSVTSETAQDQLPDGTAPDQPTPDENDPVDLPSNVHGQTAAQVTCSRPFHD
ncbi:LCP family protein [Leifsonia shinshuensis]|uniref:LCP family protein n=1 Tax=Leifsonia shinshuensis TaxID=150026 RepID=UPI001F514890|nr:LCP family protein [Leifsonia shinshuensis]MCI0156599.1 LCP family protein [Leifsonia shinshuensis]